jgi:hypothetical protein
MIVLFTAGCILACPQLPEEGPEPAEEPGARRGRSRRGRSRTPGRRARCELRGKGLEETLDGGGCGGIDEPRADLGEPAANLRRRAVDEPGLPRAKLGLYSRIARRSLLGARKFNAARGNYRAAVVTSASP